MRSARGARNICSGGPSSRIRPASRKQTRFAMSRAKPISCVAISIVIPPRASSRITASTSATSSGSSALVTSSSSSSPGSIARARTIATRCCWPPESRSGNSRCLSASPNRSRSASALLVASGGARWRTLRGASVTLSITLMWGNRLKAWKTIPIRRRIRLTSTPGVEMSSPATTIRPASIGSSRFTQRSSVDFPLPDAPIRQTTSCWARVRSIPERTSSCPNDLWTPSTNRAGAEAAGAEPEPPPAAVIERSPRRAVGRATPGCRSGGPAGS